MEWAMYSRIRCLHCTFRSCVLHCWKVTKGTCNYEMRNMDFKSSLVLTFVYIGYIDRVVVASSPESRQALIRFCNRRISGGLSTRKVAMFIHINARLIFSCNNIARMGLQNTTNMQYARCIDDRLMFSCYNIARFWKAEPM